VNKAEVIIPRNHPNPPEEHEVEAAWILARHYNTTVQFLIPIEGYKVKTNDIVFNGLIYEIKSPKGDSRTTIGNLFKAISKKRSQHFVLDARRTRLKDSEIINRIRYEMRFRSTVKKVLFINKESSVIEITNAV